MALTSPEVNQRVQRFLDLDGYRSTWEKQAIRDYAFYEGKQFTSSERKAILARGQAPLVINRIFPQVQYAVSSLSSRFPWIKAIPVSDDDPKVATVLTNIIMDTLYHSDWLQQSRKVLHDMIVTGVGYYYVYLDSDLLGRPQVKVRALSFRDVYIDPESRQQDLSDAADVMVTSWITRARAKILFPEMESKIDKMFPAGDEPSFTESTYESDDEIQMFNEVVDVDEDKLRYIEHFEKIPVDTYVITIVNAIGQRNQFFLNEEAYRLFEEKHADDINSGEVLVVKTKRPGIRRTVLLGDELVEQEVLPTSRYPIVPVYFEHIENPYPPGMVRYLRGIQREVNKRRMLMIAHATASTGVRYLVPRGSVDKNSAEEELSKPIGFIDYNPGMGEMHPLVPPPLPNEFYRLESEAKADLEYIGGAAAMLQGFPERVPKTVGVTRALAEWSRIRMGNMITNLYMALQNIGRLIIDYVQATYTSPMILRLVNPIEGETSEVAINVPMDDFSDVVERINDITTGRYDVYVVPTSVGPSNRAAQEAYYLELYDRNIIDDIEMYKKLTDVDREGLIKRKSMLSQMQHVIQMQQQYISELESQAKSLKNRVVREEINRRVAQIESQLEKARFRSEAQADKISREMQAAVQDMKTPLREA